ncbi:unnamed protein product [Schistosoma turkestanicum]|nr:unnamed protein product [Schistosoma turkestanicum]
MYNMTAEPSEENITNLSQPVLVPDCMPVDITNAFFYACRIALEPGELLHGSWFNLQYSMSAIEIMDPKMDAGIQGNRKVVTISEALSNEQLPLGPFSSLYELLGIIDELLAAYVNWITGDSLAQSIFICMYMHCTQLIRDKYLAAFCELLRRSIYQLRDIIIAVGVFDEEDYCVFTHGMPIHGPSKIFDNYSGFRNDCLHKLSVSELIDHINDLNENLESESSLFTDGEEKLLMGLRNRLQFVQALLKFTNSIFERIGPTLVDYKHDLFEGYTHADLDLTEQNSSPPKLYEAQNDIEVLWNSFIDFCREVSRHISNLKSLSDILLETSNIGKMAGEGKFKPKDSAYGLPGFEIFLNQTNTPSYMPKVVNIHDRHKSFTYFSSLFTRLNHILCTYEHFALWHDLHPEPLHLYHLWTFIQKSGQLSCPYIKALLFPDDSSKVNEPALTTCVLSRTITYMFYCTLMWQGDAIDFKLQSFSPMHFHCFLNSWHCLEPTTYRPIIKNIISSAPDLMIFFSTLSAHFAHIPAVYCLNRSRQRSALGPWLQSVPDFLDECTRVEFIIGVELKNKLTNNITDGFESVGKPEDLSTQKPVEPVQIKLSYFITYVYYYLAWDYIVSGFQLELYSSSEWLFIYAFMIHLFQNLSTLIGSLLENCIISAFKEQTTSENKFTDSRGLNKQDNICDPVNDVERLNSRQSKKKKKHREKGNIFGVHGKSIKMSNTANFKSIVKPVVSSMIHEIGSSFEVYLISVHQHLNTATLYAIRALQRDSGIEINLNPQSPDPTSNGERRTFISRNNHLESYARRLGIFIIPRNSPLVEVGGISGAYETWTSLLSSSIIDGRSTSDLYLMASRAFDEAQNLITKTLHLKSLGEENLLTFTQSHIALSLFIEKLGPPDQLTDLQQLARRNSIACRVLGVCEDRRPVVHKSNPSTPNPKMSFLCSNSPVKLDYNFLESKCYPLIRLGGQSKKCS